MIETEDEAILSGPDVQLLLEFVAEQLIVAGFINPRNHNSTILCLYRLALQLKNVGREVMPVTAELVADAQSHLVQHKAA